MKLWTLATLPQTIQWVRALDPGYADWMERKYANFLPGGKYA